MAIKDEIRRERKAFLATATPKQKLAYFLEYYKLHIVVAIILIVTASYIIYHACTDPEIVLNGMLINVNTYNQEDHPTELGREFLKSEGIDTSKYDVSFGSGMTLLGGDAVEDYQGSQALMIQTAAGALDFATGPAHILIEYAYGGVFVDLTTVLSAEELETYKPYLHYIDGVVLRQFEDADGDLEGTDSIVIPDSTKPEEMKEPIPIFIDMSDNEKLVKAYATEINQLVFGITANAPNPELTQKFIKYLMQ